MAQVDAAARLLCRSAEDRLLKLSMQVFCPSCCLYCLHDVLLLFAIIAILLRLFFVRLLPFFTSFTSCCFCCCCPLPAFHCQAED